MLKLDEVCNIRNGNPAPQDKSLFMNGKYPFFRVSDLAKEHTSNNLVECKDYLNDNGTEKLHISWKGTTLIPKSGVSAKLNHRALLGLDGYVVSHCICLYPKDINKLLPEYLYYFSLIIDMNDYIASGYTSINRVDLNEIEIPLPPLNIQQQLVDKLNSYQQEIDKARNKILEIRNNIKSISFEKYSYVQLGNDGYVEFIIGGTPATSKREYYKNGTNLWLTIKEMNSEIIYDTKKKITDSGVKNSNAKLIPKGTLLFSFKLSIGKIAVAGNDLYTNEAIAGLIIRDNNKLSKNFLFGFLKYFLPLNQEAKENKFGKTLNSQTLKEIKIPLPSLLEQQAIVTQIEKEEANINQNEDLIRHMKEKIEEILTTLYEI